MAQLTINQWYISWWFFPREPETFKLRIGLHTQFCSVIPITICLGVGYFLGLTFIQVPSHYTVAIQITSTLSLWEAYLRLEEAYDQQGLDYCDIGYGWTEPIQHMSVQWQRNVKWFSRDTWQLPRAHAGTFCHVTLNNPRHKQITFTTRVSARGGDKSSLKWLVVT
jgi:hypothetical protein